MKSSIEIVIKWPSHGNADQFSNSIFVSVGYDDWQTSQDVDPVDRPLNHWLEDAGAVPGFGLRSAIFKAPISK